MSRMCCSAAIALLLLVGCGGNTGGGPATLTPAAKCAASTSTAVKIAFQSDRKLDCTDAFGSNNIWVVDADGSGTLPLTNFSAPGAGASDPVWSPDGSKIAFDSTGSLDGSDATNGINIVANIWVMNADGSGRTPLTRLTTANSVLPVGSPDGSKIIFLSARALDGSDSPLPAGPLNNNIWIMNADGSGAQPLTKLTQGQVLSCQWSPDSSKIVYTGIRALDGTDQSGAPNIWVIHTDGSNDTPLTKLTIPKSNSAQWSPDGTRILYSSTRELNGQDNSNNTSNLWLMNADGSGSIPLTQFTNAGIFAPAWSPDGSKIGFGSNGALDGSDALNAHGTSNFWTIKSDGSALTAVTKLTQAGPGGFSGPVWSLDGTKIAFVGTRPLDGSDGTAFNPNIWIMNADGSAPLPLTKLTAASGNIDEVQAVNPSWRP